MIPFISWFVWAGTFGLHQAWAVNLHDGLMGAVAVYYFAKWRLRRTDNFTLREALQ